MNSVTTEQLLGALKWRYATKAFDPAKKISTEIWQTLEKALLLSPSSYGLQPYRFLVITDSATRAELLPHSRNQKQVVDCSHFVVFAARTEISEADVDRFLRRVSEVRRIAPESLAGYRRMILEDIVHGPRARMAHEWAARQAYIALGSLMTCAAILRVDACPMEGLNPSEYDRLLHLHGSGYATVVACALGYRSPDDPYARQDKVRRDAAELVKEI
ncbi:MAG TPA: NAD(P)H-dependent oxidoreductase [Verrucomicrobiae bacterium]|nr:NAD(P)H-dependent oxidoreductase [Verrucomicrobiae bacterium]